MRLADEFRKVAAAARQTSDPIADVEAMGSKGQSVPPFSPNKTAPKAAVPAPKDSGAEAGKQLFRQHLATGKARVQALEAEVPAWMARGKASYDEKSRLKSPSVFTALDAASPIAASLRNDAGTAAGKQLFQQHMATGKARVQALEAKVPEWMSKGKSSYEEKARPKTPSVLAALDMVNPESALERARESDPIYRALRAASPEHAMKRLSGEEKPIPESDPLVRGVQAVAARSRRARDDGSRSATRTIPITGRSVELSRKLREIRDRSRSPSSLRNMVYGTTGDRRDERVANEARTSLKAMDKFVDYKSPSLQELMDKRKKREEP